MRSRIDLDRFMKLPWRIYAEDPHWAPPLVLEVKEFLNRRKHPFYKHGDATQFIAVRGDAAVGRILVSDDPRYNEERGENLGCFGMFECDNDPAAAHGLLERRGRLARGPRPDGHSRPDRLFAELSVRPAGRRIRHAAAGHDEPRSPVLRRTAGIVGPAEGEGSLRMVVRRSARSGGEMAAIGPSGLPGEATSSFGLSA